MKSFRTLTIGLTLIACALGVNGGQAVIETVGLEEFAGGTNIPFPRLSMNAIDQFTALVNDAVGGEVLDAHYYKSMTQRPRGLILVPGDNQKDGPYDLLVLIDETGGLLYMDSKQSHSNTFQGHSFAKVGRYTIESRKNARSSNVVSNFRGDFWIVDHGTEAILRVRHEWTGERNVFTVVGRYKPGEGRLVDIYYTDMKTEDPADDRLYYISQLPSKIVVIAPFFEGDVSGATLAKRQSKTNPSTIACRIRKSSRAHTTTNRPPGTRMRRRYM